MASGRLRTVSFDDEGMEALGEEMLSWIKENEKSVLHLSQWYTIHKGFTYKEWKTFIQREVFIPYYEQALKIVGLKYVDKTSNVRDSISQRWQRVYFGDIRESEDTDADADVIRKANALKSDARAIEEERQKVIDEVQRNKRELT